MRAIFDNSMRFYPQLQDKNSYKREREVMKMARVLIIYEISLYILGASIAGAAVFFFPERSVYIPRARESIMERHIYRNN